MQAAANPTKKIPAEAQLTLRTPKPRSLWQNALRYLFHQRLAVVGMVILAILIFVAVFAPLLAPYDPNQVLIGI